MKHYTVSNTPDNRSLLPKWLEKKAQTFPDKIVVFTGEGAFPAFPGDVITKTNHPHYDYVCAIDRKSGMSFDPKTGEAIRK